ncbi:hypothetical protein [Muricoccus aerilatus]|uniref:hypothetical protein n=1 Tax=Muricoccus aerilatus TaxID=452982 RepID=UPI0005C1AFCD|nr:hypothetical protein [Roseomonas aerilata]
MSLEAEREALALLRAIRGELDAGTQHLRVTVATCDRIAVRIVSMDERLEVMAGRVERIVARLGEEAGA